MKRFPFFVLLLAFLFLLISAAAAAASAPTGRIVYCTYSDTFRIVIVNPTGSNLKGVAPFGLTPASPVFSPDGRRVAFIQSGAGFATIYVYNTKTKHTLALPHQGAADAVCSSPTWISAKVVLFAASPHADYWNPWKSRLYTWNLSTGHVKRLAPAGAIEPDCSPSKARIVFVQFVNRRDENGTYLATERLRVMDLRSGSAKTLRASRHPVWQEWRAFQEPTISPNGRYIAFNTHATDPGTSYSILLAGGRHLWTSPYTDMPAHCSWSPDSKSLLWTQADLSPISTVRVHSVVTGKDRQIGSPQAVQITAYDWSPDGHWLLYDGYAGSDANQTIWVMGVDGSGLRALADGWNADWGR